MVAVAIIVHILSLDKSWRPLGRAFPKSVKKGESVSRVERMELSVLHSDAALTLSESYDTPGENGKALLSAQHALSLSCYMDIIGVAKCDTLRKCVAPDHV